MYLRGLDGVRICLKPVIYLKIVFLCYKHSERCKVMNYIAPGLQKPWRLIKSDKLSTVIIISFSFL